MNGALMVNWLLGSSDWPEKRGSSPYPLSRSVPPPSQISGLILVWFSLSQHMSCNWSLVIYFVETFLTRVTSLLVPYMQDCQVYFKRHIFYTI